MEHDDHDDLEPKKSAEADAEETTHTAHAEHEHASSAKPSLKDKLAHWWYLARHNKKLSIPLAIVSVVALCFAIPFTRYLALGLIVQQDFQVVVLDSQTNRPVSSAVLNLRGKRATTDGEGKATLRVPVGRSAFTIEKAYYHSLNERVLVPMGKGSARQFKLQATGRPVPLTITNKVTGKPISGAVITAGKSTATTDDTGQTILVVPTNQGELQASVQADGYNTLQAQIKVTVQKDDANNLALAPAGSIYFLSNASGKLDLVKANLDGSNRKTVLAGTGKEDRYNTVLFASRDWKHIALLSKRDGGDYAKLFLVEAETDKALTIDEGEAYFTILGWSGDRLIYRVDRPKVDELQSKHQSIKSYSVANNKITALFDTTAEAGPFGTAAESIADAYVFDQQVVFVKNWVGSTYSDSATQVKRGTIQSVKADGTDKKTIKTYPNRSNFLSVRQAEFGELYIRYSSDTGGDKFDEYKDGKVQELAKYSEQDFYNSDYPVYAVSPSGKKTLWSDFRDGKYVFFVGDAAGENGKQIGASEDFTVYGWFTDDYILLTRKGSELRILPVGGLDKGVESSLKVTDYYKPNYGVRGYGYGYGG